MAIYIFDIIALVLYILSFTLLRRFYRLYTPMRAIVTVIVGMGFLNAHLYIPAVMFFANALISPISYRLFLKLLNKGIREQAQTALFLGIPSALSIFIGTLIENRAPSNINPLFSFTLPVLAIVIGFIVRLFDGKIVRGRRIYPIVHAVLWGSYAVLFGVYLCALYELVNMIQHIRQRIAFRKSCRSMQRPEGSADSVNGADGTSNTGSDEAAMMQDFTYFKGQW